MELEEAIELLRNHFELVEKGYQTSIRFGYLDGDVDIYVHGAKDLVKLHKDLGIPLKKESDGGSMCARGKLGDADVTVFPEGGVFPGCRLVKKRVFVPAEPAVKEHWELRDVVECE